MNHKNWKINPIFFVSLLLLGFSLSQKSYCSETDCGDAMAAFILGAIGFVEGGATLCWLANPLLLLSWVLSKTSPKASLIFSALALIIALSFLGFDKIIADEAGNYETITGYAAGYWLWISSIGVMLLGSLFRIYFKKEK